MPWDPQHLILFEDWKPNEHSTNMGEEVKGGYKGLTKGCTGRNTIMFFQGLLFCVFLSLHGWEDKSHPLSQP
jgi:hypothetical protein